MNVNSCNEKKYNLYSTSANRVRTGKTEESNLQYNNETIIYKIRKNTIYILIFEFVYPISYVLSVLSDFNPTKAKDLSLIYFSKDSFLRFLEG